MSKSKKILKNTKSKIDIKLDSKTMTVDITKTKKIEKKQIKKKTSDENKKIVKENKKQIKKIPVLKTQSTNIDDEKIEKEIIDEQIKHEEKLEQELELENAEEDLKTNINKSAKKEKKKSEEKNEQMAVDKSDYKNQIEALLFACGKAMPVDMICNLTEIDKRNVKKALEELKKDYELRNNSLNIFEESDSWKINVREKYLHLVRKIVADTELPRSTMETLAVIAWKSPIYQSEVVRIRGNKCYDHIEALEELGFVSKDKKGRSYVLKVTDKFFNYFDIDHGNLKEILDEIKKPIVEQEKSTTQATLSGEESHQNKKTEEIFSDHTKNMMGALEVIEIRKKEVDENEKTNQDLFLDDFDKRISEVSKRTNDITADMPKRNIFAPSEPEEIINTENLEQGTTAEISTNEAEANPQSIELNPITEHHPLKPKSLTKKQLEKKYKDDLIRLREKMEKKKSK